MTPASDRASAADTMERMPHSSTVHIDLGRLAANTRAWRALLAETAAQPPKLCAIVKADAYGLGAVTIAAAMEAEGVDMLAVYSLEQALPLLGAGVTTPLLVLMPTHHLPDEPPLADALRRGQMHWSIDAADVLVALSQAIESTGGTLHAHLNLDTGMSRGGMDATTFGGVLAQCRSLPAVRVAGVYTHFASPIVDFDYMQQQLAAFDDALARHADDIPADALVHTAGTCAALRSRQTHRDMVRVGLGLYGYGPQLLPAGTLLDSGIDLQPIVRWTSRIVHIQRLARGRTVGYKRMHQLRRDSVLGLVPVGHGDGYPVALSDNSVVELAGGRSAPLLGMVNMDQIIVDLTDAGDTAVGDEVTLLSDRPDSPCHPAELARRAKTNVYEMLCRLCARLPRCYVAADASASRSEASSATR